jgi:hypothetical protein
MQRGTITILIIVSVAVLAAIASVFYHYRNQQNAQRFWGTQTAQLIDKAPQVKVLTLGAADASLSLPGDDDAAESAAEESEKKATEEAAAEPTVKALEFNGTPWIVMQSKDAAQAKGISNLRRVLVLDTTFDWSEPPSETEPRWAYGLAVEDGRDWATVLFDFDSRQVGLAGGRKTAILNPEANDAFKTFFAEQFPPAAPATDATPAEPAAKPEAAEPASEPTPPKDATPADSPAPEAAAPS